MRECRVHINDGKITNRQSLVEAFKGLHNGPYLITIKNIRKRTLPQNDYYWGCVVPMVREGLKDAGYDDIESNEDAHEVVKHLFLKKEIGSRVTGEVIELPGSTARLTTIEFGEYLEKVWKWSAEFLNVHIPGPNEPLTIHYLTDTDK